MWKKRVEVTVASSTKQDMVKKAQELLKKGVEPQAIKDKLNVNNVVNVMTNSGVFEEGSDALPKTMKYNVGVSEVFKEGEYYFVTNVERILPETAKSLDECRGKVVNDYQQYLEQRWVDDLKKEFTVKVNTVSFDHVKKQLQ